MTQLLSPSEILTFWTDAGPDKWFAKDAAFDRAFTDRCCDTHYAAARRELDHWTQTPQGALALIILLDQLPRNAFRDTGHMFATDSLALMFAKAAIQRGDDRKVAPALRPFLLMPLMHSESLTDQELLLTLWTRPPSPTPTSSPSSTGTSSPASAASRIATPAWGARPLQRRRTSLKPEDFQADARQA